MNEVYVFDFNGTLTPLKQPMEYNFAKIFLPWLKAHKSYLVSGATYEETMERLPSNIFESFYGIYTHNGSVGIVDESEPEQELLDALEDLRSKTKYAGTHNKKAVEHFNGLIKFSVIGLDAEPAECENYAAWDSQYHERKHIKEALMRKFKDYDISIRGQTTIYIGKKYGSKLIAQIISEENPDAQIKFFGNTSDPDNHNLIGALKQYKCDLEVNAVQINSPDELLEHLKKLDQT